MKRKGRKGLFARLRFWLGGLVVLLVAIVVAGYAVVSSYDFEELRSEIERQAQAATGRKLTISGPIDLKVSLTPAITLEGVTFANADWGSRPAMATVKRFELEVALLPLLTGKLVAKRLVLVEPDILLETGPQGEGNWNFEGTT
ncbi:MAG: AsmA family protein, partial [Kiloniellales bacterium]